ncbi:uncharacterized protein F4822DRAFT_432434 [Hypoxylon trugodes]|uniref:uncharacterized protein n=1 Tax=Hypoxylon trugodes TaxID=326681 RepID=UPI00219A6000|nr:uncharacterized protein F4822DRAFT_432434 [Hypoxylon trugodes]KAI1385580.1 hypothetical protein F4822DRAFT_432434 [Hypoxylon trugodes]
MAEDTPEVNPMADMRHARETVSTFQKHIERLEVDETRPRSPVLLEPWESKIKRHRSNNSDGSSSRRGISLSSTRWNKSVGKEWAESRSGALWHEISNALEDVAKQFKGVDSTALKEFVSTRQILELGTEFVRIYRCGSKALAAVEKPPYAAGALFWSLQGVKQGDTRASQWTRASAERQKEWDLSGHLARFVLLADGYRRQADREDWDTWNTDFATNTSLYLCILRCFLIRDKKQRELAQERELGLTQQPQETQDRDSVPRKRSSRSSSSRFSRSSRGTSN